MKVGFSIVHTTKNSNSQFGDTHGEVSLYNELDKNNQSSSKMLKAN